MDLPRKSADDLKILHDLVDELEHSGFVVEFLSSSDLWVYKLCPTKKTQLVC